MRVHRLGLWVVGAPVQTHAASANGRAIPGCEVHKESGEQTLTVLESAGLLKQCTIPQLRTAFAGRSDAKGRAVIGMIEPQSMSSLETLAGCCLRREGCNVLSQLRVKSVGHVDLLVEGGGGSKWSVPRTMTIRPGGPMARCARPWQRTPGKITDRRCGNNKPAVLPVLLLPPHSSAHAPGWELARRAASRKYPQRFAGGPESTEVC